MAFPLDRIRALLQPTLEHMGYELYDLRQVGPGGRTLQITIDRAEGIGIDDCERVSNLAGPLLDQAELMAERYMLEVSSPGAERPLRNRAEYERFVGSRVNVRYRVGDSEVVLEGTLVAADGAGLAVQGKSVEIVHMSWDDLIRGRLAVAF